MAGAWLERQALGCRVAAARGPGCRGATGGTCSCSSPFTAAAPTPAGVPGACGAERSGCPPWSPMPEAGGVARGPSSGGLAGGHSRASLFPRISCGFRFSSRRAGAGGWRAGRSSSSPPAFYLLHALPLERRPPAPGLEHARSRRGIGDPRALPSRGPEKPAFPAAPVARLQTRCGFLASAPVPATEHAQSRPPPPSFNMGTEVLRLLAKKRWAGWVFRF